jgi:hypothetical protein
LGDFDIVSKLNWKGNGEHGQKRASTAFWYQCILSQVLICVLITFWSYLTFWWGNGVKGPNCSLILVLYAKGGEIKAKTTGSANHLWISKKLVLASLCLIKTLLLQKLFSYGGENWLWEKGEFLAFDKNSLERSFELSKQVLLM